MKKRKQQTQEEKDLKLAKKVQKLLDEENFETLIKLQNENLSVFEDEDGNIIHLQEYEEHVDAEYVTSHLNHDIILWSSNPKALKPHEWPITSQRRKQLTKNSVVNTFFVCISNPVKSENTNSESIYDSEIEYAVETLAKAQNILVVAGAGIGVDSGLPDYRSSTGFYGAYPSLKKAGLSLQEISHPDWFRTDPTAAWGFYAHRAYMYQKAKPHEGFESLLEIVKPKADNSFIFTSNIDGQFHKAGFEPDKIFECHGSLQWLQCLEKKKATCKESVWPLNMDLLPPVNENTLKLEGEPPRCPHCGSVARPNVSMYGDTTETFISVRSHQQYEKIRNWLHKVYPTHHNNNNNNIANSRKTRKSKNKPVKLAILEIGCGVSLHSISIESEFLATEHDKDADGSTVLIRINPNNPTIALDPSQITTRHASIGLGAKEALTKIATMLAGLQSDEE